MKYDVSQLFWMTQYSKNDRFMAVEVKMNKTESYATNISKTNAIEIYLGHMIAATLLIDSTYKKLTVRGEA